MTGWWAAGPTMAPEHRLHPVSALFRFGHLLKDFAFLALPLLVAGRSMATDLLALALIGVLVLPAVIGAIITYATFRYRYEADDFVVRSGLVFRNERHIPYARIQNIDAVQNPIHRLFRVAMIRIETGSGTEAEATLAAVPVAAIADMRRRMFEGRGAPIAADEAEQPASPVLLKFGAADALVAGFLLNRGYLIIAAAIGLVFELGPDDMVHIVAESRFGREATAAVQETIAASGSVAVTTVALTIAGIVLIMIAIRLVAALVLASKLHGFVLSRSGSDLRTESGLFTRVTRTVGLGRIQRVIVHESFLHRRLGRASLQVVTTGHTVTSRSEIAWLAPLVRADEIDALVGLVPGLAAHAFTWNPPHPSTPGRKLRGALIGAAACALPVGLIAGPGWGIAALLLLGGWMSLAGWLYARNIAWAEGDGIVAARAGWLRRKTVIAVASRVHAAAIRTSPFDRRAGTAKFTADTPGHGAPLEMRYLPIDIANRLHATMVARAGR